MKNKILYAAHRGTSFSCEGNTIPAIEIAFREGFDYIEIDVQSTKDNKLLVFHDKNLDNDSNFEGLVKKYNSEELQNLISSNTKEKFPLFDDLLNHFKDKKINWIIDLKSEDISHIAIDILHKYNIRDEFIISSPYMDNLEIAKKIDPSIKVAFTIIPWIVGNTLESIKRKIKKDLSFKIDMLGISASLVTEEFLKFCKDNDIVSTSWEFYDYEDPFYEYHDPILNIKKVIEKGINLVFIDDHKHLSVIKNWVESN